MHLLTSIDIINPLTHCNNKSRLFYDNSPVTRCLPDLEDNIHLVDPYLTYTKRPFHFSKVVEYSHNHKVMYLYTVSVSLEDNSKNDR
jgi:hypothetical protein